MDVLGEIESVNTDLFLLDLTKWIIRLPWSNIGIKTNTGPNNFFGVLCFLVECFSHSNKSKRED